MSDETKHMLEHTSKWVGLCLNSPQSAYECLVSDSH